MGKAVAVAPSNSNVVYAAGATSMTMPWFFKTTSGGPPWDTVTTLSGTKDVRCLAVDPGNANTVYAGKPDGLFKSINGGGSWTNTGLSNLSSIAIDPLTPATVYAATTAGVNVSTTGGGNWTAMNQGLECLTVTDLEIVPGDCIVASTYGGGHYRWELNSVVENRSERKAACPLDVGPNPFREQLAITFAASSGSTMTVYDAGGRRVRRISLGGSGDGGVRRVSWPGDDDAGRSLAPGVYFLRLENGCGSATRKVLRIR